MLAGARTLYKDCLNIAGAIATFCFMHYNLQDTTRGRIDNM